MSQFPAKIGPVPTQLFINNQYIDSTSPERLSVVNPYNDSPIPHQVHSAGKDDVDAAVSAASHAYKNTWGKLPPAERQACMLRFADLVERHIERLAILESLPTGKPVTPTMQFDLAHMVQVYRYYAGWTDKLDGASYPETNGVYKIVRYEPLGVCAGIASWNATFLYIAWKIAPALAAGNCFIFKPSEKSPFGALALGELYAQAGFPPGTVQILSGAQTTGALLASHMGIAKISFTGSVGGGKAVQDLATRSNLKRTTLELGGKSPAIVFEDVDVENAAAGVAGFLANCGQICVATSRVLLHASIAHQFTTHLKAIFDNAAASLPADPLDPSTTLGPVVDKAQFDRVMGYIEIGKKTATLLTGGERAGERGCFIKPTIFVNPEKDSPVVTEEIFGPVLVIQTFGEEEEAVQLANGGGYGLAASIYTKDLDRALRVSSQLECGGVAVNSPFVPELNTPFGGVKMSGLGRELGKQGLLDYMEPKSIHIRLGPAKL